ncbi:leucine-rich repeat-containing protein 47-like [Actinia tenebrosa]|uniref:Leucine-rich repeat-containing protein 47-like n=1 Tax=Actinia tenebrosa TaxID=6105 RepID=A0A6P8IJ21_ACTTE|nr:leucine-rich repeat-containing protein 47-like [Actinia tenebrosa]
MSWSEVEKASQEQRYELVLNGSAISERISSNGLDISIFQLTKLNFLQISNTNLEELPSEIGNLVNLKTLDLHRNALKTIPASIENVKEIKTLDISGNSLNELPVEFGELDSLHTLNLNCNQLSVIPSVVKLKHLARLDISHNELCDLPDGIFKLELISEIRASSNKIGVLSEEVSNLQMLKVLDMSSNVLEAVPVSLANCLKLKELNLKENRIKDNRLGKLINQCSTKSVLDYVASMKEGKGKGKKSGKKGRTKRMSEGEQESSAESGNQGPVVKVIHGDRVKVLVQPSVLGVRPFIVCTLVRNLDLSDPAVFKKFITIQTKLHESICDQRTVATIATHDLSTLTLPLMYDAAAPTEINLVPLGRQKQMNAEEFVSVLKTEALKQKQKTKRNTLKSGLYKFLSLVEGAPLYAFLRDSAGTTVSLPPVTNSEACKIKASKIDVLIEVTSPKDLGICKQVMAAIIEQMLEAGIKSSENDTASGESMLLLEQVRVTNADGQLKVVYPSNVDLLTESFKVIHLTDMIGAS